MRGYKRYLDRALKHTDFLFVTLDYVVAAHSYGHTITPHFRLQGKEVRSTFYDPKLEKHRVFHPGQHRLQSLISVRPIAFAARQTRLCLPLSARVDY